MAACAVDPTGGPPPGNDNQDSGTPPPTQSGPDAKAPVCPGVGGTYPALPAAGNVLFLMDRSGSMQIKLTDKATRWVDTKTGLFNLLQTLPASTRAGAMMFPQGDKPITCCSISPTLNDVTCNCKTGELPGINPRCEVATYSVPVAIGPLGAAQVSDIEAYISSSDTEFYWGTPLAAGLTAAIDAQVASKLDGTKSVVLLTDGYPTSCDSTGDPDANDIQRVIDAAAAGKAAGIRTFVLGVIDGTKGARADYLSPIAEAGGTSRAVGCSSTDDCFYALNNTTFSKDLKAALDQIEVQAFDCSFEIPQPNGGAPDLSKLNVQLDTTSGTQIISRDTTHSGGWDFLPTMTHIQLYGAACDTIKADPANKVEMVVGCLTQGQ